MTSTFARSTLMLGCAFWLATSAPQVQAATGGFPERPFTYRADNKKLAEVVQDFGSSLGIPTVVDPAVTGVVNGDFNARAQDFLNAIGRTHGVIWYFDGTTLFVYPARAMQSKVFRMRGYSRAQVRQMLAALDLGDARFPLRFDDATQTLLAYGPPRHIELVTTVLEQLERSERDRVGGAIRVIRLQHATAADRVFGETQIPGLARTLNGLFQADATAQGQDPVSAAIGLPSRDVARRMRSLSANYGFRSGSGHASESVDAARQDPDPANKLGSAAPVKAWDADIPFFQAEAGTNSIIVRGVPDRMREYEALVRQLDVVQDLVEIEATIIDIDTTEFNSLGFDWSYAGNGVQRLSLSTGSPTPSGGLASEFLSTSNITTLLGGSGRQLLARIRALEGQGRAHIVSRPRVVGAANRMATMSNRETASVRVQGNLEANLFQVETGTRLQIVPQIIAYDGQRDVRLTLSIKDGKFDSAVVDDVPIVKETQIDTDATLSQGESLLIGGIAVDSDIDGFTGVPVLSRVPVLGHLFKHRERSRGTRQRLFLLTPKIIEAGPNRRAAALSRAAAQPSVEPVSPDTTSVPVAQAKDAAAGESRGGREAPASAPVRCQVQELGSSPNCPVQGF